MLEGVEQGIVALPVHDAVAVTQDNADWAKEAMLRSDMELRHANSGGGVARSRVKVDAPVSSLLTILNWRCSALKCFFMEVALLQL